MVGIIVVLFFSPFIGVWINYSTSLYICDLYTFGISDRKDFFTVWIALFGAIGIAFNIYQNQKRTKNQEEQLEKQQTQIDLQRKSQRDSRFSKGIELLGNDNESARTGAAYSLCFLAKDYPNEFSQSVFDILCSHIRTLTTSEEYLIKHPTVSNEVQTILDLLFKNDEKTLFSQYTADLTYAHLEKANFTGTRIKKAYFIGAHLEKADFTGTRIEEAYFGKAILKNTELGGAHLGNACFINMPDFRSEKADFESADLTGANLYGTHLNNANLRGVHLDKAHLFKTDLRGAVLKDITVHEAEINIDMKPFLKEAKVDLPDDIKWTNL